MIITAFIFNCICLLGNSLVYLVKKHEYKYITFFTKIDVKASVIMVFQLVDIVIKFLKLMIWVTFSIVLIPYCTYVVLMDAYPDLIRTEYTWFWIVFLLLNALGIILLIKPIFCFLNLIEKLGTDL